MVFAVLERFQEGLLGLVSEQNFSSIRRISLSLGFMSLGEQDSKSLKTIQSGAAGDPGERSDGGEVVGFGDLTVVVVWWELRFMPRK
eukprot:1159242-Pelagomonas_calceolata.AAC.5